MKDRECLNCGKIFNTEHGNQKFCSSLCRAIYAIGQKKAKKTRSAVCDYCGNRFKPQSATHTFCSNECRKSFIAEHLKVAPVEKVCVECKKAFTTVNTNKKYCCYECAGRAASRTYWEKIKTHRRKKHVPIRPVDKVSFEGFRIKNLDRRREDTRHTEIRGIKD